MSKNKQQRFDEEFIKRLQKIRKKRELMDERDMSWREFSKIIVQTPGALDDLEKKILQLDKDLSKKLGIKFDGGLK